MNKCVFFCCCTKTSVRITNQALTIHLDRCENISMSLSLFKSKRPMISYNNTFYSLRYEQLRYLKCLFTKIQKTT